MEWTKFIRLTFSATIVALSAACGSSTSPAAPPPPPPTFVLTGTVIEVSDAARIPARNVPVEISPTRQTTVTDSSGTFSISGLVEGTYELRVTSLLHEPLSTTVQIQGATRIDLEIVPRPVYAVSGIVSEDTENGPIPVSGVLVNNSEIHSSFTTDANGAYRVFALRGGAYISFDKSGYVSQGHAIAMESNVLLDVKLVRH